MKNILKPSYSKEMGCGHFAAGTITWICSKCGKQERRSDSSVPSPTWGGKCPDTASGNHVWTQA